MDFKKKVRSCREELQLTQEELGKRVGVYRTTVIEWEKGRSVPKNAKVRRSLARVLNVKYEDLFDEVDKLGEMFEQRLQLGMDFKGLRKTFKLVDNQQLQYWEQILRFVLQHSVLTEYCRSGVERCLDEIERIKEQREAKGVSSKKKNTRRGGGRT